MKKLLPLFILIFAVSALAQPATKYRGKQIIEMSNMLGEVDGFTCEKITKPIIGTIVKRDFYEDEIMIASIVLKDSRDNRIPVNINDSQVRLLGRQTSGIISSLLTKGFRVQVWAYECTGGGSGLFTYADKVKVL